LPVWLPKLAVVNHWHGNGAHLSEARILMPDSQRRWSFRSPRGRQHQFF
jgi:hypothetical protein